MYGQTEDQEKQKKKIIIVSLIMGIIIIVLIGVLISAITSKNKAKLAESGNQTSLVRENEKAEDTKLDPVANDTETGTKSETETETKAETTTITPSSDVKSENLPTTGASSVLGLAVLAGSATTYLFSKKQKRA